MLSDSTAVADERSRQAELDDLANAAQKDIENELKSVLTTYLNSVKPTKKTPSKDDLIIDYSLINTDKDSVLATERLVGASFLLGMEHSERDKNAKEIIAADEEIPAIPFSEAQNFLKSKVPITKSEWDALEPNLRFRAFTVAKLAEADYLDAAHSILSKSLENGKGYAETWESLNSILKTDVLNIRHGYWENVYRTNTQSAYIAGKLQQFEKSGPVAYRLLVIDDSRTSDICRHLVKESGYGVVLSLDNNFWKKYGYPPYHYQCRTGIQGVFQSQLDDDPRLKLDTVSSKQFNDFEVQKGFGGNPLEKESWWKMSDSMIERAGEYGILDVIIQLLIDLGIDDYADELANM